MPNAHGTTEATVALACQGGGSHAAYTAGVLKAILRRQTTSPYRIVGFSGTSGGAICALLAWYGQMQAGPNTPEGATRAGELLDAFWQANAACGPWERVVNRWSVELQRLPVEVRLSPYELPLAWTAELLALWSPRREFVDLKALLAAHVSFPAIAAIGRFQAIEAALRSHRRRQGLRDLLAAPDRRTALDGGVAAAREQVAAARSEVRRLAGFERVKQVVERAADRAQTRTRLEQIEADLAGARRALPVLLVGAVNVLSGTFKSFSSLLGEISVESVAASATLPWLFRAQPVDGGYYWDGLFSQNPPILNFVAGQERAGDKPDEIWVVQINPQAIAALPTAAQAIQDRRARLAGNLSLNQEIESIEAVNKWVADGSFAGDGRLKEVAIHRVEMDADRLPMHHRLDTASKVEREAAFIRALLRHGEAQAALFWPVRCFVEEVVNGRAPAGASRALHGCVAADAVLRFPPRWPEVRGRAAVGGLIARWREAFAAAADGRPSLRVAIRRMEPHHAAPDAPPPKAEWPAPAGPADGITWEIDWELRGRLADASGRPGVLVRLEGAALATVASGRVTDIAVRVLDAARGERARPWAGRPFAAPEAVPGAARG